MAQSLLQFIRYEITVVGPALETLRYKVVRKALKLAIAVLHLVVLSVEDHRLLNLFNVALVQDILADGKLFETEIRLQSIANLIAS